jgi:probable HAF family extracellular repeat protein
MKGRILGTILSLFIIAFSSTSPHADSEAAHRRCESRVSSSSVQLSGMWLPESIDKHGRVAGWCRTTVENTLQACLWSDGSLINLGYGTYDPGGNYGIYINDRGQVVGNQSGYDGSELFHRVLLWENGTLTDLNDLAGTNSSRASGINDRGQVVGESWTSPGFVGDAFFWEPCQMTSLHVGFGTGFFSAINNRGQVLLLSQLWDDGKVIELSPFVGSAINDHGMIAGTINRVGFPAAIWKDGVVTELESPDPSVTSGNAFGINNAGQVIATSYREDGTSRTFFWEKGTSTELGTLDAGFTEWYGINERGQVYGSEFGLIEAFPPFGKRRGVVWEKGHLTEIEPGVAANIFLTDMNDRGQVVGYRVSFENEYSSFLWENGETIELGGEPPALLTRGSHRAPRQGGSGSLLPSRVEARFK